MSDICAAGIAIRIRELDEEEYRFGRSKTITDARKYYIDKVVAWHRKEQAKINSREAADEAS